MRVKRRTGKPEPLKIPKELEQAYEWAGGGELVCQICGKLITETWWIDEMDTNPRHYAVEAIKDHKAKCTYVRMEELKRLIK